jgi:hypothetical protein
VAGTGHCHEKKSWNFLIAMSRRFRDFGSPSGVVMIPLALEGKTMKRLICLTLVLALMLGVSARAVVIGLSAGQPVLGSAFPVFAKDDGNLPSPPDQSAWQCLLPPNQVATVGDQLLQTNVIPVCPGVYQVQGVFGNFLGQGQWFMVTRNISVTVPPPDGLQLLSPPTGAAVISTTTSSATVLVMYGNFTTVPLQIMAGTNPCGPYLGGSLQQRLRNIVWGNQTVWADSGWGTAGFGLASLQETAGCIYDGVQPCPTKDFWAAYNPGDLIVRFTQDIQIVFSSTDANGNITTNPCFLGSINFSFSKANERYWICTLEIEQGE